MPVSLQHHLQRVLSSVLISAVLESFFFKTLISHLSLIGSFLFINEVNWCFHEIKIRCVPKFSQESSIPLRV